MKEIEYYIESNTKIMEEKIKQYENTDPENQSELLRLKWWIDKLESYIEGLRDAKKYIEKEKGDKDEAI